MPKKEKKESNKEEQTSSTTVSAESEHKTRKEDSDSTTYRRCSTRKPALQEWATSASKDKEEKLQRRASSDLEKQISEQKIGDTEFFFAVF